MTERWLPVVGYEGLYEVSDLGRVKSVRSKYGNPRDYVLTPKHINSGYLMICLARNKHHSYRTIHRLVAEAFIGPRPARMDINHLDSDRKNNRADNLEYVTRSENMRHAVAKGRCPVGEKCSWSRLTEKQVRSIRKAEGRWGLNTRLAGQYGLTPSAISLIRSGRNWKHVS